MLTVGAVVLASTSAGVVPGCEEPDVRRSDCSGMVAGAACGVEVDEKANRRHAACERVCLASVTTMPRPLLQDATTDKLTAGYGLRDKAGRSNAALAAPSQLASAAPLAHFRSHNLVHAWNVSVYRSIHIVN